MLSICGSRVEISYSATIKLGTSQIVTRRIHSFQALYVSVWSGGLCLRRYRKTLNFLFMALSEVSESFVTMMLW